MSHIFISYVHEDSDRVQRLKDDLNAAGGRTWIDSEDIRAAENWRAAVRNAVADADFFFACFSNSFAARQSNEMYEELRQATDQLRKRSPATTWFQSVFLDDVEPPDLIVSASEPLRDYQQVHLYRGWDAGIERLLKEIDPGASARRRERKVLGQPEPPVPEVPEPTPEPPPAPKPTPAWIVEKTHQVREALHGAGVRALAFDPAGARLMTSGGDVTHVWQLPRLGPLPGRRHDAGVVAAAFSPAGGRVATATDDRIVRLLGPRRRRRARSGVESQRHRQARGAVVAEADFQRDRRPPRHRERERPATRMGHEDRPAQGTRAGPGEHRSPRVRSFQPTPRRRSRRLHRSLVRRGNRAGVPIQGALAASR